MNTPAIPQVGPDREQMRAHLDALAQENAVLMALIDLQFSRIYRYPRATLSRANGRHSSTTAAGSPPKHER